jgi:hypothetical protein
MMERSADHDSIPAYDSSNDQWDDQRYPKGTPTPAAHQSSASIDVMQGENSSKAKASNPWSTSLKSTISEDLSRRDKDQCAKLHFLQKRLDRPTLKSLHDEDDAIYFIASRERYYPRGNRDQLSGRHNEAN